MQPGGVGNRSDMKNGHDTGGISGIKRGCLPKLNNQQASPPETSSLGDRSCKNGDRFDERATSCIGHNRAPIPVIKDVVLKNSARTDSYKYRIFCAEKSNKMVEELDLCSSSRLNYLQNTPGWLTSKERDELWHQHILHQAVLLGNGSYSVRKAHMTPDYEATIKEKRWGNCDEQSFLGAKYYTTLSGRPTCMVGSLCEDAENAHTFWIDGLSEGADINNPETWEENAIIGDPWNHTVGSAKDQLEEMRQNFGPAKGYEIIANITKELPHSVRVTPYTEFKKISSWDSPDSPKTIKEKAQMNLEKA
jgi:hypothetical protein